MNGDGFDDFLVGSRYTPADAVPNFTSGETYLIFGGNFTGGQETQVGGPGSQTLTANRGPAATDILIGGLGDDTLISDGGSDILRGAAGNDALHIPDPSFAGLKRLIGGNGLDTLRLARVTLS